MTNRMTGAVPRRADSPAGVRAAHPRRRQNERQADRQLVEVMDVSTPADLVILAVAIR
jgi:hypothetical protein